MFLFVCLVNAQIHKKSHSSIIHSKPTPSSTTFNLPTPSPTPLIATNITNTTNTTTPFINVSISLPTLSPEPSQSPECPNDCMNIGKCKNGRCECPLQDPRTNQVFRTPPSADCALYGEAAFEGAWLPFRVSWGFVFSFFTVFLLGFNIMHLYANNWQLLDLTLRHWTLWMINFAVLFRAMYYIWDPYSLHGLDPIFNRVLFSLFYPLCMMAYILLLLQLIDICNLAINISDKQRRVSYMGAWCIMSLLIALEVGVTIAQMYKDVYESYFLIHFGAYGIIAIIIIPLYIYYGNKVLSRMNRNDENTARLRSKILSLSYGPSLVIIFILLTVLVNSMCFRRNPFLFVIGDSMCRFTECLGTGIFVFTLIPSKS